MAGVTIFVVDLNNVDHQLDNVTDIDVDNTTFAEIVDGTYRNEGPIFAVSAGGTGGGIPEPGVATVGSTLVATAPIFASGGTLPTAVGADGNLFLPDPVSAIPPHAQMNPQSVVKFTHSIASASPFTTYSTFWLLNNMKGIKTSSATYTTPKSLWT